MPGPIFRNPPEPLMELLKIRTAFVSTAKTSLSPLRVIGPAQKLVGLTLPPPAAKVEAKGSPGPWRFNGSLPTAILLPIRMIAPGLTVVPLLVLPKAKVSYTPTSPSVTSVSPA